ncbi:MAG TPA: DUF2179 domain-containing protein [Anaerolineae bacterium]|nr:DUF2179 domain-containing protein [Anaerolineae bacterium]
MDIVLGAILIFLARLINVAMATVRTLLSIRGQKTLTAVLGFFEALIFVLTISQVLQNLGNVWNLLGYCSGFAAGSLVGIEIEGRLALGYVIVRVVSRHNGDEVTRALRQAGYGVTESIGRGMAGKVRIIDTVVKRKDVPEVTDLINRADARAFITVEDASRVQRGYIQPRHRT